MKHLILVFCVGASFISCNNDDEPSNRDLLNGRHWILKEVDSGPFGYYNDLYKAVDLSSNRIFNRNLKFDNDLNTFELRLNGYTIFLWSLTYTLFFSLLFTRKTPNFNRVLWFQLFLSRSLPENALKKIKSVNINKHS